MSLSHHDPDGNGILRLQTADGHWCMDVQPEQGGMLRRLLYTEPSGKQRELLAGPRPEQEDSGNPFYRGVLLYPFVNRLDAGRWCHRGRDLCFPVNEAGTHTSLHGFLHRRAMRVVHMEQAPEHALICLQLDYPGDEPGYPFPAEIEVQYRLNSEAGLDVTLSVINLHPEPVPLAVGWHPYLSLNRPVDELYLQLPVLEQMAVSARLLPSGTMLPFDDFRAAQLIGAWQVDHSFRVLTQDSRVTCRLWEQGREKGIELWQQRQDYPWLHLFIPPDRLSIAIEPVSSSINAFNSGEGLRWLACGERLEARCGINICKAVGGL
jgi:aldose 1-epimerase